MHLHFSNTHTSWIHKAKLQSGYFFPFLLFPILELTPPPFLQISVTLRKQMQRTPTKKGRGYQKKWFLYSVAILGKHNSFWGFPCVSAGKESTWNVGAAAAAQSRQSCPTLCDPIDGSSPGSSVPGILQARTLEWVAISFSNAWKWKVKVKSLSRVQLLATPWIAAYQAPQCGRAEFNSWVGKIPWRR